MLRHTCTALDENMFTMKKQEVEVRWRLVGEAIHVSVIGSWIQVHHSTVRWIIIQKAIMDVYTGNRILLVTRVHGIK